MRRISIIGCALAAVCIAAGAEGGAGLQPGVLPTAWKTGGPNCVTVPDWQVHEYNEDFYILRESGCVHFEKPFLYLMGIDHLKLTYRYSGRDFRLTDVSGEVLHDLIA